MRLTRRNALTTIAVTIGGASVVPRYAFAQTADTPLLGSDVCVLTPDVTQGPYYFDPKLVRADITEGRPGVPIRVQLQIVDAACRPMPGTRVDLWHCDASGLYSNYAGQGDDRNHPTSTVGETFLRGTQIADDKGMVRFKSIYPGWYHGRTTHAHFKVFLDKTNVLTGQIFFPDALSEFIYQNVAPYSDRTGERDTLNADDGIAQQATRASFANVKEEKTEYLVSLIIGVDPRGKSHDADGPPSGGPPPGPPPGGGPSPGRVRQGENRAKALVPSTSR